MKVIKGTFETAKIFTDKVDKTTLQQVKKLLEQPWTEDLKIRIMPDCHAGKGCTIGTTMTIKDKIVPNLVGVDIGCGMTWTKLGNIEVDFPDFDRFIRNNIPAGFNVHQRRRSDDKLKHLHCLTAINLDRALKSIGTLGGGNHFIEIDHDDERNKYLVVHSGSRHLGKQVADYYQKIAYNSLRKKRTISRDLAYLEGDSFDHYLHDMQIAQQYASNNRCAIINKLLEKYFKIELESVTIAETIHNYIDMEQQILRKGAISAKRGEIVLIPLNMRDGSLICRGKGNPDWNYSAPHGAGRIMSRRQAKKRLDMNDFLESMAGIFSTSIRKSTLDEAPMVYKPMEEILKNIGDTVDVIKKLIPLYNFKA